MLPFPGATVACYHTYAKTYCDSYDIIDMKSSENMQVTWTRLATVEIENPEQL